MALNSRQKGARGEREVRDIVRRKGYTCSRDGQISDRFAGPNEDLKHNIRGVHLEVKRRETLALPQWHRQADADAHGREPVVVYRRSQEPWRASVDFEFLLDLLVTRDKYEAARRKEADMYPVRFRDDG